MCSRFFIRFASILFRLLCVSYFSMHCFCFTFSCIAPSTKLIRFKSGGRRLNWLILFWANFIGIRFVAAAIGIWIIWNRRCYKIPSTWCENWAFPREIDKFVVEFTVHFQMPIVSLILSWQWKKKCSEICRFKK